MLKNIVAAALVILIALSSVTACVQQQPEIIEEAVEETPVTENFATGSTLNSAFEVPDSQVLAQFENDFRKKLYKALEQYTLGELLDYAAIVDQMEFWVRTDEALEEKSEELFIELSAGTTKEQGEISINLPGWRLVATMFHRFGDEARQKIANRATINLSIQSNAINMEIDFSDILQLLNGEKGELSFSPKLTFAYLNTVYDDEGNEKDFKQYELSDEYLIALQDPLPGKHIKEGWYKSRDKGARKHTGTDIKAPEDTPILSCTDGVVLHIGVNEGAGNYVVVKDALGIEYHYYHMVRMTDFLKEGDEVKKGDVIGNVGNTGNSAANHLHLTMISPDFTYINPYPVLRDMRKLQK